MKNISTVRKFGVGIASLAMVASMAAPAFADSMPGTADNNRWAGMDRYETSIAVAKNFQSAATVYVARGDVLVDAITAGSLKGGPLLLVNDNAALQSKVKDVIGQLGATQIVVIGGEKAVSKDTVKAITPDGVATSRISGKDRFETAANVAEAYKKTGGTLSNVYLANGTTMVDALVGGQLKNGVILLTDGASKLPAATAAELNKLGSSVSLYALGGNVAITDSVMQDAAVSQSIMVDSFIQDNQAAIAAVAKAEMMVNGYVTLFPGKTVADVAKAANITDKLTLAKMQATAPKISEAYAKLVTSAKLFKAVDSASKAVMADTNANAYAQAKPEETTNGVANDSYTGTSKALVDANAAKSAFASLDLSAASQLFNSTPATADVSSVDLTTGVGTLNLAAVEKNWPGQFKGTDKVADFLSTIGVPLPADGKQYVADEVTAANAAFNAAQAAAQTALGNDLTAAATANTKALKDLATAQVNLNKLRNVTVSTGYKRIAGADRYATSVEVAKMAYGNPSTAGRVYFANGMAFADAAVSGMLDNSSFPGPVLLVKKDSIPDSVAQYAMNSDKAAFMSHNKVIALGGAMVISDKNLKTEADALAPQTDAGKLSITFSSPMVSYSDALTLAETTKNATVKVTPTVQNAPSGTTQHFYVEYRLANGTWQKTGNLSLANSKATTVALGNADAQGAYSITVTSDGATGATADADKATVEVRLVGEVLDANGQTVGQPQMSAPASVVVSQKA